MQRRSRFVAIPFVLAAIALLLLAGAGFSSSASKDSFEITSTYIEACSCDMFCPCYLFG